MQNDPKIDSPIHASILLQKHSSLSTCDEQTNNINQQQYNNNSVIQKQKLT